MLFGISKSARGQANQGFPSFPKSGTETLKHNDAVLVYAGLFTSESEPSEARFPGGLVAAGGTPSVTNLGFWAFRRLGASHLFGPIAPSSHVFLLVLSQWSLNRTFLALLLPPPTCSCSCFLSGLSIGCSFCREAPADWAHTVSDNGSLLLTRGREVLPGSLFADAVKEKTIGALNDPIVFSVLPSHGRQSETVYWSSLSRVATRAAALALVLLVILCFRRLELPLSLGTEVRSLAASRADEAAGACGGSPDGEGDEDTDEDSPGSEEEGPGKDVKQQLANVFENMNLAVNRIELLVHSSTNLRVDVSTAVLISLIVELGSIRCLIGEKDVEEHNQWRNIIRRTLVVVSSLHTVTEESNPAGDIFHQSRSLKIMLARMESSAHDVNGIPQAERQHMLENLLKVQRVVIYRMLKSLKKLCPGPGKAPQRINLSLKLLRSLVRKRVEQVLCNQVYASFLTKLGAGGYAFTLFGQPAARAARGTRGPSSVSEQIKELATYRKLLRESRKQRRKSAGTSQSSGQSASNAVAGRDAPLRAASKGKSYKAQRPWRPPKFSEASSEDEQLLSASVFSLLDTQTKEQPSPSPPFESIGAAKASMKPFAGPSAKPGTLKKASESKRRRPSQRARLPPRLLRAVRGEQPQEQSKGSPKSYGAINYSSGMMAGQPFHHALSFVPQSGLSPLEGLGADEVSGLEEPNAQVPTLQDASISTGDLLAAELATLSIDTFPSRSSTAFTSQPRAEPPAVLLPGQLFTRVTSAAHLSPPSKQPTVGFAFATPPPNPVGLALYIHPPALFPMLPIEQHGWGQPPAAPQPSIQDPFFGSSERAPQPPSTTAPLLQVPFFAISEGAPGPPGVISPASEVPASTLTFIWPPQGLPL
ncbi:hypothetical protein Efla_007363 [Eimeria flavescens]